MPAADAFRFSALSLPYAVLTVAMTGMAISLVLVRADTARRLVSLAVLATAIPYALGHTLLLSCTDPDLAQRIARLYFGPVALSGPALMAGVLVIAGQHERHRALLFAMSAIGLALCIAAWVSDLAVDAIQLTRWGFYYPHAGPLAGPTLTLLLVAPLLAVKLVSRSQLLGDTRAVQRRRKQRGYAVAIAVLAALSTTDLLLLFGVGVYPWSVVASMFAVGAALVSVVRYDLWLIRGFDRGGLLELAAVVVVAAVVAVTRWGLDAAAVRSALVVAVLLAPALVIAQVVVSALRGRGLGAPRGVDAADAELEEFIEATSSTADEAVLASGLSELLGRHGGLEAIQVRLVEGDALRAPREGAVALVAADAELQPLDARVRAWLLANRGLLVVSELAPRRLGGLREPVEALFTSLAADVVIPLVDRDELVAVVSAEVSGRGTLSDERRSLVVEATRAAAAGFTYLHLFREAEARLTVAREVEVASAVQQARATGEIRRSFSHCEIIACYRPAANFGGDWWTAHELPDGRVLVAIGDVSGRGVPVALISSTVEGACETTPRILGSAFDLVGFLHLLNREVLDVGGGRYGMSCFVALFDPAARTVQYANAGHPFPYICRATPAPAPAAPVPALAIELDADRDDDDDAPASRPPPRRPRHTQLHSLIARGTPLGVPEPHLAVSRHDLAEGDLIVFYTSALVDACNADGEPYGDRRLQRMLRDHARPAGAHACQTILDDATSHHGGAIGEDLTLLSVRLT